MNFIGMIQCPKCHGVFTFAHVVDRKVISRNDAGEPFYELKCPLCGAIGGWC